MVRALHIIVKVNTKAGEGVKNTQKFDYVVYGWPLGPQVIGLGI